MGNASGKPKFAMVEHHAIERLKGNALRLYCALRLFAGKGGCFPGSGTLCKLMRMQRRSLQRARATLVAAGAVVFFRSGDGLWHYSFQEAPWKSSKASKQTSSPGVKSAIPPASNSSPPQVSKQSPSPGGNSVYDKTATQNRPGKSETDQEENRPKEQTSGRETAPASPSPTPTAAATSMPSPGEAAEPPKPHPHSVIALEGTERTGGTTPSASKTQPPASARPPSHEKKVPFNLAIADVRETWGELYYVLGVEEPDEMPAAEKRYVEELIRVYGEDLVRKMAEVAAWDWEGVLETHKRCSLAPEPTWQNIWFLKDELSVAASRGGYTHGNYVSELKHASVDEEIAAKKKELEDP